MEWPQSSPELNPIKNLWSVVKMKIYEGNKQYNLKVHLWEAIKTTMSGNEFAQVKKINKINKWHQLLTIIEKGIYITM